MMTLPTREAVALVLALLLAADAHAIEKISLDWRDVGKAASGRKVVLVLSDQSQLAGKIVEVQSDRLVFDVRKTLPADLYKKGRTSLPRKDVSLIRVSRRGFWWQLTGAGAGFLLGGYAGYQAGSRAFGDNSGGRGLSLAVVVMTGITLAGFLLGRQADQKTILIQVVPANSVDIAALSY